jgi:hypothetical protein
MPGRGRSCRSLEIYFIAGFYNDVVPDGTGRGSLEALAKADVRRCRATGSTLHQIKALPKDPAGQTHLNSDGFVMRAASRARFGLPNLLSNFTCYSIATMLLCHQLMPPKPHPQPPTKEKLANTGPELEAVAPGPPQSSCTPSASRNFAKILPRISRISRISRIGNCKGAGSFIRKIRTTV